MMGKIQIKNAKISNTTLGVENHGILSFFLYLDYGGSAQGFGGYALDGPDENGGRIGSAFGTGIIREILDVLEVKNWEDLKGTPLRAECSLDKIYRIGHLLKDKWVDIEAIASRYRAMEVKP